MSLFSVFNVAGSALNAETIRLNTTASNLANAESVNGDPSKVYRARQPVFQAMLDDSGATLDGEDATAGVRDLGKPVIRNEYRSHQYGAGFAAQDPLDGSLKLKDHL